MYEYADQEKVEKVNNLTQEDADLENILSNEAECLQEIAKMRKELETVVDSKLARFKIDSINICMIGKIGSSKSTITNGFFQALHGRYETKTKTDSSNETVTRSIVPVSMEGSENPHDLTKTKYGGLKIFDIFGHEDDNFEENEEFVDLFFKGRVKDNFQLEDINKIPKLDEKNKREFEHFNNMPHVIIYVFNANSANSDDEVNRRAQFFDFIKKNGVPGLLVASQIDRLPDYNKKFYSDCVKEKLSIIKNAFGFNSVYPISNYTGANHVQDPQKDFMYLYILKRATQLATEYINYSREFVEIDDQFNKKSLYVSLKTLQMSLYDFIREAKYFETNREATFHIDIGKGFAENKVEDLKKEKLRDYLISKDDEPYISRLLVHRKIEITCSYNSFKSKPGGTFTIKEYPLRNIDDVKEVIKLQTFKDKKLEIIFADENKFKVYLRDYLMGPERNELKIIINQA